MHKYIFKRLFMLLPVIAGVTFVVFFIMAMTPGDTAKAILGEDATPEAIEAFNEKH